MVANNGGEEENDEGEILLKSGIDLRTSPALGDVLDPVRYQAETARNLAYGLLVIFAGSIIASVVLGFVDSREAGIDMAKAILPFTGGPLAVALGSFFGVSR